MAFPFLINVRRYFTEVGIGTHRDEREAITWFRKAAESGDKRAIGRLRALTNGAESYPSPPTSPRRAAAAQGNAGAGANGHGPAETHANGQAGSKDIKEGKRSRRATLLGMTSGSGSGTGAAAGGQSAASGGKTGKKGEDCIIS